MPVVSQNPQSSGGGSGGVQVATVAVSSAQLLALFTTPVTLVPGVAGKVTVVNGVALVYLAGSTPYTDHGGNIEVLAGPGTPSQTTIFAFGGAGYWDQATSKLAEQGYGLSSSGVALADLDGTDISLAQDTANPTLGNGTLKVTVSYFLAPAS